MDVDGGAPRTIVESIDVRGTAAWSPDGKWLVVGGGSDPNHSGLFKVAGDGGPLVQLRSGFALDPAWSSKDDLIVFAGDNVSARAPLLAIRPNGEEVEMPPVLMTGEIGGPRFLADGSGIVYLQGKRWAPEFWLIDLKTKTSRQLTRISDDSSQGTIGAFDVTPDGRIIFGRLAENSDIVLINRPPR
jgi:Tol biopolymer transport system component